MFDIKLLMMIYIVKQKSGLSERTQTQRCPFSNYRTTHNGPLFEKSCHVIMGFCAVYSILTNWNTKGGNLSKKGFEFMLSSFIFVKFIKKRDFC